MKLSVVVPVYNVERYLAACLDSLRQQTFTDWEAICVDDGSTDGSAAILDAYAAKDPRIVVRHLENGGAGVARNFALSVAQGDWIGFVDADDWVSEDYFGNLVACAESSGADIAATSGVVISDGSGTTVKDMGIGAPGVTDEVFCRIRMFLATGSAWNKIYRAGFLREHDIRFPATCCAAEDNGFTLKALACCRRIAMTDGGYYNYRIVSGSLTHSAGSAHDERSAEVFRGLLEWVDRAVDEAERRLWRGAIVVRAEGFPGFRMRVIASLTSYPPRIATVHKVVESLKAQSFSLDKIVLWLSEDDFPSHELPSALTCLVDDVFDIRWVRGNLRSHKKYFYALQEFESDAVITFDDDILYPQEAVATLVRSFRRFPDCISARRVHLITLASDGGFAPYREWKQECLDFVGVPMFSLCATTGGGTLFPPYAVPRIAFDEERIRRFAGSADDLWLKFTSLALGVRTVLCSASDVLGASVAAAEGSALWRENVLGGANDTCVTALTAAFGQEATLGRISAEQSGFRRRNPIAMCLFRLRRRIELALLIRKEALIAAIAARRSAGGSTALLRLERMAVGALLCLSEHGPVYSARRLLKKGGQAG